MIKCRVCKTEKEETCFAIDRQTKRGRQSRCKECRSEHYQQNKDRAKEYALKRRYGISLKEYTEQCEAQNNLCEMCGKPPKGRSFAGVLHVDHNHETGARRGLICNRCNTALGLLEDGQLLADAWTYLAKYK